MTHGRLPLLITNLLLAAAGAGMFLFAYADESKAVPGPAPRLDFPTTILPILTKAGCNAGACHGAATGQAGFKLSLLGYDPEFDHRAITHELAGRRIDMATPAQSLLLRKATRGIRHKGGERIELDSADYKSLATWIAGGASFGPSTLRVASLEVQPTTVLLAGPGASVGLKVTATLSDGTVENVTSHALYSSNDDGIADVSDEGKVIIQRRGSAAIMVRYGGQVAAVQVASPLNEAQVSADALRAANFIDEKVFAELRRLRVPPSLPSDDAQFLRRAYLDLIGRLPEPAEILKFTQEPSTAASRAKLIDDLLERDEYADLWTLRLADLLLIDSKRLGAPAARVYRDWLRDRIARNVSFDRTVRDLLTATGETTTNGPANFHRLTSDPRDMSEYVSSAFLGIQIACARCHAHPFAAWTQDDYYRFAAFFARTRQEGSRIVISNLGEVQHPKTLKDVAPKPLGDAAADAPDRLRALADWTVSPRNPYFARAIVNRVWRHLLGRGIVEPVDDMRISNPPSNAVLLDALADEFIADGYDLRKLIRTIARSNTYQLSSVAIEGNRADERLFSHAYPKPLRAAVLADAVAQATDVADAYPDYPPGTRAVQLIDARTPSDALDILGRCTRDTNCDTQTRGGGLAQSLHLINGSTINAKMRGGIVDRFLKEQLAEVDIVEQLYLRTLSRPPTESEKLYCIQTLASASQKRDAIEDILWALLNSREFVFNN
jgi:hypothetical protein